VADAVWGRRLHSSQELTGWAEDGLTLKMRLNSMEEVERLVLSIGTHATGFKLRVGPVPEQRTINLS
jgi:hypothetical protein